MRVIQLIDTLEPGGAERVAVNIANGLARRGYASHLCATRRGGPLEQELEPGVKFLNLQRSGRWDVFALLRLVRYVRQQRIQIIHAHSSSLFIGSIAARLCGCKLVWHDHFGASKTKTRSNTIYRFFVKSADAIFSVTRALAAWAVNQLNARKERVMYLPNFVSTPANSDRISDKRVGEERIMHVGNLRAQKDQITLLHAFKIVRERHPTASLALVGAPGEKDYSQAVYLTLENLPMNGSVTLMGKRSDVPSLLNASDIAVLSSRSEGFPLVLLEYGYACLPVVATDVGECAEILDHGAAGILVPPGDPVALAAGLMRYLEDPDLRRDMAQKLHSRVQVQYSEPVIMTRILSVYETILGLERAI